MLILNKVIDIALVKNNAVLGAQIAASLAQIQDNGQQKDKGYFSLLFLYFWILRTCVWRGGHLCLLHKQHILWNLQFLSPFQFNAKTNTVQVEKKLNDDDMKFESYILFFFLNGQDQNRKQMTCDIVIFLHLYNISTHVLKKEDVTCATVNLAV